MPRYPKTNWRKRSTNFRQPAFTRNLHLVETMRAIGQRYKVTPGAVAIAWTLWNLAVTGAIVGVRRPQQVDGILGGAKIELDSNDLLEIEQQGEVREGDTALYARIVWALVHGASMLRSYADPDLIRSSVRVLRSGMMRSPGNPDPVGG